MDWLDKMNAAIDYIETNLNADIDYAEIAKRACCSSYNFQRMFSFITDVTLAEYIRRRRLTQAAFDIQHKNLSVIEVALNYGYDSPVSFARAFQAMHGVNPREAKKEGINLKLYPKLSFQITMKGVRDMNYRIEKEPLLRFLGISRAVSINLSQNFQTIPQLWEKANHNGSLKRLRESSGDANPTFYGICDNFQDQDFRYSIAVKSDQSSEEFQVIEVPSLLWAKFECQGVVPDAIQDVWKRLYSEWFPTSGYEHDDGPEIEWYSQGDMENDDYISEVWIPIRKIT